MMLLDRWRSSDIDPDTARAFHAVPKCQVPKCRETIGWVPIGFNSVRHWLAPANVGESVMVYTRHIYLFMHSHARGTNLSRSYLLVPVHDSILPGCQNPGLGTCNPSDLVRYKGCAIRMQPYHFS